MELKTMVKDSLLELVSYVERAIPEIEQMADDIYTGIEEKAIEKIPLLVEGLKWIVDVLGYARPFNSNALPVEMFLVSLNDDLKDAEGALETQDWVMFADLLQYQLIPLLKQIGATSKKVSHILN